MSNYLTIGIDPGKVTGAAVYNSATPRLVQLTSLGGKHCHGVYEVIEWMASLSDTLDRLALVNSTQRPDVIIAIEDTRFMTIYEKRRKGSKMAVARVARSVGQIDLAIELIATSAKKQGFDVRYLKPLQGHTKLNAHDFVKKYQIDEIEGRINQHARDAYPYALRASLEKGNIPLIRKVKCLAHYSQIVL